MTEALLDTSKIRRWKQYAELLPTGEEWLGAIPNHWSAVRIKHLCQVKRGASPRPIDDPAYFDENGEYAWVRIADVTASEKYLLETSDRLSELGKRKSVCLEPGRLFLSIAATVGKPIITRIKCCIHDGFVYFVGLRQHQEYWYYVFASGQAFFGLGKLGTQLNLNTDTIGGIRMPVPPPGEQRAIAAFLDRETARIDALIEKKERLIALLEEKRQGVISHAVTRGLDPNVELKDSGTAFWGHIPAHWTMSKLRHFVPDDRQIMYGIVLPGPHVDDGIPIVKGGNCESGKLRLELLSRTTHEIDASYARSRLQAGDIVYAIRGSIGSAQIVPTEVAGANITQDVARVSPKSGTDVRWLLYALQSIPFFAKLEAGALGATIKGINIRDLKRADIPSLEQSEQSRIADFLDEKTATLDTLVQRVSDGIERLQEYRTALISATVTGQIDVREEVTLDD